MSWMTGSVAALVVFLGPFQDAATDQEKLEGTWKVVQMVEGGKELPKDKTKNLLLIIKDDRLILRDGRDVLERGTFEIDPKTTPKEWTTTSELDESKPIKCIYKITPRQLVLCIGEPGGNRPKEFISREKTAVILLVLERNDPPAPRGGN